MQYIVVGVGTDVGKTVVSAIVVEALKAYYWKPVQAGDLQFTDSHKVAQYALSSKGILPEKWRLNTPASPHYAAELDAVSIQSTDFELPNVVGDLIIEGAGGLMVPLNANGLLYLDIVKQWDLPVILVSRHYLGSINHTLMSLALLKEYKIKVHLVVFNGDENQATESIIKKMHPELTYHRIPNALELNVDFIQHEAERIREKLI